MIRNIIYIEWADEFQYLYQQGEFSEDQALGLFRVLVKRETFDKIKSKKSLETTQRTLTTIYSSIYDANLYDQSLCNQTKKFQIH